MLELGEFSPGFKHTKKRSVLLPWHQRRLEAGAGWDLVCRILRRPIPVRKWLQSSSWCWRGSRSRTTGQGRDRNLYKNKDVYSNHPKTGQPNIKHLLLWTLFLSGQTVHKPDFLSRFQSFLFPKSTLIIRFLDVIRKLDKSPTGNFSNIRKLGFSGILMVTAINIFSVDICKYLHYSYEYQIQMKTILFTVPFSTYMMKDPKMDPIMKLYLEFRDYLVQYLGGIYVTSLSNISHCINCE